MLRDEANQVGHCLLNANRKSPRSAGTAEEVGKNDRFKFETEWMLLEMSLAHLLPHLSIMGPKSTEQLGCCS